MRVLAVTTLLAAFVVSAAASALHPAPPLVRSNTLEKAVSAPVAKVPVWEFLFETPQEATNPIAHKDVTYVPTNTTLYALDAITGRKLWAHRYKADGSSAGGGYAAACDELVVVGTYDDVIALHPSNGTVAWVYKGPSGARPNGYDGIRPRFGLSTAGGKGRGLYITTGYTPLVKLSMSGAVIWTAPAATGNAELHATEGKGLDLVYFVGAVPGDNSYIFALDVVTSNIVWRVAGVWTILVSDESGIVLLQGKATKPDGKVGGTFTAANLRDGTVRYQLFYEGWTHIDDYFTGTSLYVMTAPGTLPYDPTTFYKYSDARNIPGGKAQWIVPKLDFLFFTSCRAGIINFGPQFTDGYDEKDGTHLWRYAGVAVNAGVHIESSDAIVAVLKDKVVALKF